ncbi:MAG: hypothetical protein KKH41_02005 [Candidatus Thermoplasmatota archaeon]|nr:hypothetical protein [Candidatus Thermoplasmatota archaeon]
MALSTFVMTADVSSIVEGKESVSAGVTYIVSAPFRINNNTDFATSPKVTGGNVYTISVLKSAERADKIKSMNADYTAQFRTPLTITAVLTATSEEFLLSWLAISNPITTNPSYEVYYSSDNNIYNLVSTTSSTSYVMDAIAWDCQPHTTQLFKVKAYNTAGCNGESAVVSAECGRVDYFLDVGSVDANVYEERDMPFTLDDMPRYGLTLPPQSTGLHLGWSAPVPGTGSEPKNWRQGMQGYQQMFLLNLGSGSELNINYLLTFHFEATGTFYLEQKIGEGIWLQVGEINGHRGKWETASIRIDQNNYYDHSNAIGWEGMNILFRFSAPDVIFLDWIKANRGYVGYFVQSPLYALIEPELEAYVPIIGQYANVETEIINGLWTTHEEVKQSLKMRYLSGLIGAVLIGDFPIAFVERSSGYAKPSSLYYMDMDGTWDYADNSNSFKPPTEKSKARLNSPEIFIGLLRPPTTDISTAAAYLISYFNRASEYALIHQISDKALLIQSDHSTLDGARIHSMLGSNYQDVDYLKAPLSADLSLALTNPTPYDLVVINAHTTPYTNSVALNIRVTSSPNTYLDYTTLQNWDLSSSFYILTCCHTTLFESKEGGIIQKYSNYLAGHFTFNNGGNALGTFGYSTVAGGGLPGSEGLFSNINQGKTIGELILAWGNSWQNMDNPLGHYNQEGPIPPSEPAPPHFPPTRGEDGGVGSNYEYYWLNFIGDPLLRL